MSRQDENGDEPYASLTHLLKSRLKEYIKERTTSRQISDKAFSDYLIAQREQIDESSRIYNVTEFGRKTEMPKFMTMKVDHVVSLKEFYVIQACHLEIRDEFQRELNCIYELDREPIVYLKENDVCITLYRENWCRAKVIRNVLVSNTNGSQTFLFLIDYGRTIRQKESVYMIKSPHEMITPFVMRCQLQVLNDDEKLFDQFIHRGLKQELIRVAKKHLVGIYFNGYTAEKQYRYDVALLTHVESSFNTIDGAYLLHECYGAMIWPKLQFNNPISEQFCYQILPMAHQSSEIDMKKLPVHISHVVSPKEIYLHRPGTEACLLKIRRVIDAYVKSVANHNYSDVQWSIGQNCLVRVQNWKTESNLKLWYRGKITAIDSEKNTFSIFMRDYGRTVEVTTDDLMTISEQLATPNNAVQPCRLKIADDWPEESTLLIKAIVGYYRYFAISCYEKVGSCLIVTLWATNYSAARASDVEPWDDLGLMCVSHTIMRSITPFFKRTQKLYYEEKSRQKGNRVYNEKYVDENEHLSISGIPTFVEDAPNETGSMGNNVGSFTERTQPLIVWQWLPALAPEQLAFEGYVTYVTDTGIVYLQEKSNRDAAYEMSDIITRLIPHIDNKYHVWKKGDACFAPFEHKCYYRATVKSINRENGQCLVHYVDYGNEGLLALDDIYPATDFGDLPILVQRFYVEIFVPADKSGKWNPVILQEFRAKLINKLSVVSLNATVYEAAKAEGCVDRVWACNINPRMMGSDIFTWFYNKKLPYDSGYNANGDKILIV